MSLGKSKGNLGRHAAHLIALAMLCMASASSQERTIKQGTLQEAQELMKRVDTLHWEGRYAAAIPLAERAVAIREKRLGPEHPDTATSINMLGRVHRYAGNYPIAGQLLKRALTIREKVFGAEHPATADSLNNLAAAYHVAYALSRAEPLYIRALAIREKALGLEDPDTLISLNNLALLYEATGDYTRAEPLFKRALAIRERVLGPEHRGTAESLANLGAFYVDVEIFEWAEPLIKRGLAIRQKVLGLDHPDTTASLLKLGRLYDLTGRFNEAEPLYHRAIHIREAAFGPEHPFTADALRDLGILYVHTGAYERAELLFLRAIAISDKALGPNNYHTSLMVASLARLYTRSGAYDRAEPLHRRALAIREKEFGLYNLNTASVLFDLAEFYVSIGAYAQAEPLHQQALAIKERVLGRQHSFVANSIHDLASLYAQTGDARAESYLRRALAIREQSLGVRHPDTEQTISALATLEWAHRKLDSALRLFQRAQTIQANNSSKFLLSGSEARKQAYLQTLETDTHKHVSFSLAVPGRESTALGLRSVLHYKGRVLDAMSESVSHLREHADAEGQALLVRRSQIANQLSILTYQAQGGLSTDEYRQRLDELRAQQESLDAELAERSSEFRRQITPVTVSDVHRAIPEDAALVEWFRYLPFDPKSLIDPKTLGQKNPQPKINNTARYMAYVLKRDADPIAIDIGDATAMELLVHEFRLAVSDSKHTEVKVRAAALSEKLLKPLSVHLQGVQHLLISPDGALNLLPMAALINDQGEYLAQRFAITYLTSGRDLLRFDSKTSTGSAAVVIADPNFGNHANLLAHANTNAQSQRSADLDRSGLIFRPLANTALEAQDIQKLLRLEVSHVLLREDATEASLKQLRGPRILHVASHGFFLSDQELTAEFKRRGTQEVMAPIGENPLLRSGIALAGANTRRSGSSDDGIFTALEAAQLDLQGTELVVLSACDSGVGDIQNGEGVYGLRRALVLAGAQTQVTSLWKVSDEATRLLMVDYYQRLLKGEGRTSALRQAQQTLLANPTFSHPYYWASFVSIGNWTPLPKLH